MTMPKNPPATLAAQIALAAQGVHAVIGQGQSAREVVAAWPAAAHTPGARALLYHTLRQWGLAQALVAQLAARKPHAQIEAILAVALALLAAADGPSYAPFTVVDQAVHAVRSRKKLSARAGFVNACLRRFLRERERLLALVMADPVARLNHPRWWIEAVRADHARWEDILLASNRRAPLTLRVNLARTTREAYLAQLQQAGIAAEPVLDAGLMLERATHVRELPGYSEGLFAVQDAAAQWAAPLLLGTLQRQSAPQGQSAPQAPFRVLDACAAPGGKTTHLLEWASAHGMALDLLALDVDATRCTRIAQNVQRLLGDGAEDHAEDGAQHGTAQPQKENLQTLQSFELPAAHGLTQRVRIAAADATEPQSWRAKLLGNEGNEAAVLDAILLDAPCSASGIVRRHPDIRWLRRAQDIDALADIQALLLRRLWPLLRPGGLLLYCTCSIFHREGREPIRRFVQEQPEAALVGSMLQWLPTLIPEPGTDQNTPKDHDGFFYALLEKRTA